MIYADETFYQDKYLLGRKPVIRDGFLFYARNASQLIDQYTFGRLECISDPPGEVSMCCCELAEAMYSREKQRKKSDGKTSEKVGTWSVTYADAAAGAARESKEDARIIYRWLENTGLCYKGV